MPRRVEHLSPSSISLYEKDPEQFYIHYISDINTPRDPQTQPMAVGSAFDAYVKNFLYEGLYGKNHNDKYCFENIFNAQVEEHNRKWARQHGKYCFEQYKSSGALADLMFELSAGTSQRFEFEVSGIINAMRQLDISNSEIAGVKLLGRPDVSFITKDGIHVIYDFKVNGYCSKASPARGYIRMRAAGGTSYSHHKDACPIKENGILINIAETLETIKLDWANQLSIYGWLCGAPVGSDFIVGIDQLACQSNFGSLPTIRVAEHRAKISHNHQNKLFHRCCEIFEIVNSNHYFRELSIDDSQARCEELNSTTSILSDDTWMRMMKP